MIKKIGLVVAAIGGVVAIGAGTKYSHNKGIDDAIEVLEKQTRQLKKDLASKKI